MFPYVRIGLLTCRCQLLCMRSDVLTDSNVKNYIFWDITLYNQVQIHFIYYLLQDEDGSSDYKE